MPSHTSLIIGLTPFRPMATEDSPLVAGSGDDPGDDLNDPDFYDDDFDDDDLPPH